MSVGYSNFDQNINSYTIYNTHSIYWGESIINSPKCKKAILEANKIIKHKGRILVRKSGTEPKIRIMSESEDSNLNKICINIIKKSIQ